MARRGRIPPRQLTGDGASRAGQNGDDETRSEPSALAPLDAATDGTPLEILDTIQARAAAEAGVSEDHAFGRPGQPFDRRSPFFIGLLGALGVAVAAALVWIVYLAGHVLVLLGLAFFVAVGLDPAVTWLARRGLPRWAAVVAVLLAAISLVGAFIALAVPVIVSQASGLADHLPHYLRTLDNNNSTLGRLNTKYHIVSQLKKLLTSSGTSIAGGVVGVGEEVLGAVYSALIVAVVTVYLLADLPRIKRSLYRVAPRSRRPRMVLLTDQILTRVGGYVLGNLATSLIAAVGTAVWAAIFGIPDPILLALMVGLLDLVPIVGSTVGGLVMALVALVAVSLPVAIGTAVFYLAYRVVEDYLLTPRIMRHTVEVPGLVTVVAVLIGGTLLGIPGALVAIPVAAAIKLLLQELVGPRIARA